MKREYGRWRVPLHAGVGNKVHRILVLPILLAAALVVASVQPIFAQAPPRGPFRLPSPEHGIPVENGPVSAAAVDHKDKDEDDDKGEEGSDVEDPGDSFQRHLIVDTDGVTDDVAAITFICSQLGPLDKMTIVTTFGGTSMVNATKNVLTLRNKFESPHPCADMAVIMGADKPLDQRVDTTGQFLNGSEGILGLGFDSKGIPILIPLQEDPDPSLLDQSSKAARNFYCDMVKSGEEATYVQLGPLTNLATAIKKCGKDMQAFIGHIIISGGAKFYGNRTPSAEGNFFFDPEAAKRVMEAGLWPTVIPVSTFSGFTLSLAQAKDLEMNSCMPGVQDLVAPALQFYIYGLGGLLEGALFGNPSDGEIIAPVEDVVAAIYALSDREPHPASGALIQIMAEREPVRGQSIIGSWDEKIAMIADSKELSKLADQLFEDLGRYTSGNELDEEFYSTLLDFYTSELGLFAPGEGILGRQPDNAAVILPEFMWCELEDYYDDWRCTEDEILVRIEESVGFFLDSLNPDVCPATVVSTASVSSSEVMAADVSEETLEAMGVSPKLYLPAIVTN